MGPEIGIAATTRPWGDQLHRFLLNHGGATVKNRVMSADQAVSGQFAMLLIDDVCSFLTPRLVVDLRRSGKGVIGVFAPTDGPDAKRRLLEVGISDVIESDASPAEFLSQMIAVGVSAESAHVTRDGAQRRGFCVAVTGAPGGVGVTEVAVGVASQITGKAVALLDLNQSWPAIGQRLALPVHPNLRTAVDVVLHEPDRIDRSFHDVAGLNVVTGLANPEAGPVPSADVATLLSELTALHDYVVVDLGSMVGQTTELLLNRVNATLVVGLGDPIGITRLIRVCQRVNGRIRNGEIGVVVNRTTSRRHEEQAFAQLWRSLGDMPVFAIPEDQRVAEARWDGVIAQRGSFVRSVRSLAALFQSVVVS